MRIAGIDLLRGLAIFLVLMNHVNMRLRIAKVPYTAGMNHQLVTALVWNGQLGVQIFFAVSGFLITSTALRRWGSLSNIDIRGFYRLRFARIAPLLLLLLAVLSVLHLAHVKNFVVSPKTGGLGRALLAALTFHVNILEAQRGYLPANWDILWSLSVEEMFYLFFPLLCRLLGQGNLLIGVLSIFVLLGPYGRTHGNEVWREYSYLGGMDAIALGCLTALLVPRVRVSPKILTAVGVPILIGCLCFSLGNATILAIGTCLLMAAATQSKWQAPQYLSPVMILGQRSYEVYLTHMFVVFVFFQLFLDAGKPMRAVPVFFIATIVVSTLLGEAVARLYSEPLNTRLAPAHLA